MFPIDVRVHVECLNYEYRCSVSRGVEYRVVELHQVP